MTVFLIRLVIQKQSRQPKIGNATFGASLVDIRPSPGSANPREQGAVSSPSPPMPMAPNLRLALKIANRQFQAWGLSLRLNSVPAEASP